MFDPGYISLFLSGFLAATVLPLSSEGILLIMLAADYDPLICLILISIANSLGGLSTYGLGYLGKEQWLKKYFKIRTEKILLFKSCLNKYHIVFACLCWLPIIGDVFAAGLGYFKTPFISTAIFMFIGKVARYIILIFLYYQF